jgi:Helicase HerA, central domain
MTANIKTLIQFHDETNSPSAITLLANDRQNQLPVMSYIIASGDSVTYFAQTQSPALWLNQNAAHRYDPSSLDTMQRIDRHEYNTDAYFNLSQFYCAEVLAEQSNSGPIIAPMTRPKAGSRWLLASAVEAQRFLSLVQGEGHSIGHVAGIATRDGDTIAIRLNVEILRHHILAAGATGSGKSNTNVNLILTAQQAGFCTLVYDMKPDYCEIDQPNDEPLALGEASGLTGVRFWALGTSDLRPNETAISVRASDLDPAKLAQVIFHRPGEENQQEMTEQLLSGYADINEGKLWSIADFIEWLMRFADAPAAEAVMPFRVVFNKQTFNAVRGKIRRTGRVPSWIDAGVFARGSARHAFGGGVGVSEVAVDQMFAQFNARSVHVIRVRADADGRSYALFLDYAMRRVADMRRDQSTRTPPVLHMIDEVADLFKSSNRRLALAMEGTLDEQIRKGRSLSIGFVLSAQSAGDIPERIRHNLNSVIVFRHHQPKILQEVLPVMSDAVRDMASKLQPGEALVQLFKTHGLLRCRMHQSPARLFKPGFGQ